jgi:hypothetical protein
VKQLQKLLSLYIQGSIHVALSAVALTGLTFISLGLNMDWLLLGFVFTATITGYNFVLYAGIAKWQHRSLPQNLRWIQLFSLLIFFAMLIFLWQLPVRLWWWIALTAALTLFYAIPVLPNGKNLRHVSGLKILIIASVWAVVTVVFPLVNTNIVFEKAELLLLLQRFLFIMALALPFEIRDLKNDALSLGTLPQRIGIQNTKFFGMLLLVIVGVLEFWLHTTLPDPLKFTYFILGITAVFLLFSTPERPKSYTVFWVESIPVIWLLFEFL